MPKKKRNHGKPRNTRARGFWLEKLRFYIYYYLYIKNPFLGYIFTEIYSVQILGYLTLKSRIYKGFEKKRNKRNQKKSYLTICSLSTFLPCPYYFSGYKRQLQSFVVHIPVFAVISAGRCLHRCACSLQQSRYYASVAQVFVFTITAQCYATCE